MCPKQKFKMKAKPNLWLLYSEWLIFW